MDLDPNLESKTPIDPTPLKRARSMKRVAEIMIVLSGMAQIRAGKEPTAVEKALAAEARERLTAIVEAEVKPNDLIDRDAVKTLVDDLGLNKRDPLVGHRSNKLSISEKVVVTKKKMEESRNFTSPTSIFAHSSMHGTPSYHTDRQNLMTYSPGGFHNILPGIHVQTIPSSRQAHVSETGASGPASSNLSQRYDAHSNMSPFTQQAQASADKSEAASSAPTTKTASEPNKPNPQEEALMRTHEDVSKRVQKILQPKVFDHPNWNPPSAEYTNHPLQCQVCKININDTESLLVCDACEKGVHLKCLMNFGNKEGIPKAEWHCPRCLIASNGRPFPPKYGRVTRTVPPQNKPPEVIIKKPEIKKPVVALAAAPPLTEQDDKLDVKEDEKVVSTEEAMDKQDENCDVIEQELNGNICANGEDDDDDMNEEEASLVKSVQTDDTPNDCAGSSKQSD